MLYYEEEIFCFCLFFLLFFVCRMRIDILQVDNVLFAMFLFKNKLNNKKVFLCVLSIPPWI